MKRILLAPVPIGHDHAGVVASSTAQILPPSSVAGPVPRRSHRSEKSTLSSLFAEPPGNP